LWRFILFLDPHVTHLQKLGANASKPGVKLNFAKKVGLQKDGKLRICWERTRN
jgi:hypothetical protein